VSLASRVAVPPIVIEDAARAQACLPALARRARLAFDTEGDGLFRYRTRLCMMQLACPEQVYLIDTLAFDALACFAELLGAEGPEKIVHDASFDARVLFAQGVRLGRVFDTAVAARFLGLKSTGLSNLLSSFFEISLPKDKQQADWGLRPLDADSVRYLVDDVCHLEALADALLARVRALDIEPEVREECGYVISEAHVPVAEVPPWTRLKGAQLRPPAVRARLRELFAEREELARELDLPPGRLIPNELLSRLAEEAQLDDAALADRLGARGAAHLGRFRAALERARGRADAPEEELALQVERPPSPAELERRKLRKRLLTEFRARVATQRGVDPQVILPGHCVNGMVDLSALDLDALRQVKGLGACRVERYGARLVSELTASWPR
jgi:ribonuclease D